MVVCAGFLSPPHHLATMVHRLCQPADTDTLPWPNFEPLDLPVSDMSKCDVEFDLGCSDALNRAGPFRSPRSAEDGSVRRASAVRNAYLRHVRMTKMLIWGMQASITQTEASTWPQRLTSTRSSRNGASVISSPRCVGTLIHLHVGFVVCLNDAMDMILGTETIVTLIVIC
jgi:hypothetical protein